jgi:hypothetical protein
MIVENKKPTTHGIPLVPEKTTGVFSGVPYLTLFPGPNEIADDVWARVAPSLKDELSRGDMAILVAPGAKASVAELTKIAETSVNLSDLDKLSEHDSPKVSKTARNRITEIMTPPKKDF